MRTTAAGQRLFSLLLSVSFLLTGTVARADEFLPSYSSIVPGLDYAHVSITNKPWSIHIARLNRSSTNLAVVSTLARGTVLGLSTVVSQAKAFPPELGKPLVAINADYFVITKGSSYQGDPLGLEILGSELLSAPTGASFWIEPNQAFHAANIYSHFSVSWRHGGKFHLGLNEECKSNSVVLYTPSFGSSTRTTNGLELILEKADSGGWLPLRVDKTFSARIREVRGTHLNTSLAPNIAVLAVGSKLAPQFATLEAGTILKLSTDTSTDVSQAQTAIGGRPILMRRGLEDRWTVTGTNTLPRHPRTAIGWNKKYFYFVVVDGRQKELSIGMTYTELAHVFKELECTDAVNLDGGGSTTFWLDGKIMNSPSDKHERAVANCLFIVDRHDASASRETGMHAPDSK